MKTYLEPAEIELMELATICLRDRLLIRLLFRLGCRVSEILAVRVSDVDLERRMVTILHLKTRIRVLCPRCKSRLAKRHQFCPVCGSKIGEIAMRQQEQRRVRMLPVDTYTLELLHSYFTENRLEYSDGASLVFKINRHRAWQIVRDCAERAGIANLTNPDTGKTRGVSPHRLRDAFSVHAMKINDSGDSLRLLQEHLGHANFNTTAKYRKIAGEEHRHWYERLWVKSG